AIDTGLVDATLPPAEIAEALLRWFGRTEAAEEPGVAPEDSATDPLQMALAVVQQKTGTNLSYVKDVNLKRPFLRRVLLQKNRDVAGYLQLLRTDADEA